MKEAGDLIDNIVIDRIWAMPNKNTFEIKPIHDLITSEMTDGLWIDPFANRNKFASITNDLNHDYDTDYHLDALDFFWSNHKKEISRIVKNGCLMMTP